VHIIEFTSTTEVHVFQDICPSVRLSHAFHLLEMVKILILWRPLLRSAYSCKAS